VIALFRAVVERTAELVAAWTVAGFVHRVINTDNLVISGESFDYGPWRFLPTSQPGFTASYFDHSGLYALARRFCGRLGFEPDAGVADVEGARVAVFSKGLELLHERCGRTVSAASTVDVLTATAEPIIRWDQFSHDRRGSGLSRERASDGPCAAAYAGPRFEAFLRALAAMRPCPGVEAALTEEPAGQRLRPVRTTHDVVVSTWDAIASRDDWQPFEALAHDVRALGQRLGVEQAPRS